MKAINAPETWFLIVLGPVVLLELVIWLVLGATMWQGGPNYAAQLVWVGWGLSGLLLVVTSSCFFWEWVLLKMRTENPARSANAAVAVFCLGLLPLLPLALAWFALI